MDRRTIHRDNLVQAASSAPVVSLTAHRRDETRQQQEEVIAALIEGKETHAEIARRLGVKARAVSKIYTRRVKGRDDVLAANTPEVIAAKERLEELDREHRQRRLMAEAEYHEAMARQCMREAQALDRS